MASFRVVYSRGSFAFAIACDTREQALTRALAISREAGVWHVHVEDGHGTRSILPELPGPLKIEIVPVSRGICTARKQA
jgi:hypothetical protein